MKQAQKSLYQDGFFRRIVIGSTGLGFAAMVGSLAALQLSADGSFQFNWRGIILPWMAFAVVLNWLFWKALWDYQSVPERRLKSRLIVFTALMIAMGLGSFLYPIRYLALGGYGPVVRGLLTAILFLSVAGRLLYGVNRGLNEADALELNRVKAQLDRIDSKAS